MKFVQYSITDRCDNFLIGPTVWWWSVELAFHDMCWLSSWSELPCKKWQCRGWFMLGSVASLMHRHLVEVLPTARTWSTSCMLRFFEHVVHNGANGLANCSWKRSHVRLIKRSQLWTIPDYDTSSRKEGRHAPVAFFHKCCDERSCPSSTCSCSSSNFFMQRIIGNVWGDQANFKVILYLPVGCSIIESPLTPLTFPVLRFLRRTLSNFFSLLVQEGQMKLCQHFRERTIF